MKQPFKKITIPGPEHRMQFIEMSGQGAKPLLGLGPCMAFTSENRQPYLLERTGDEISDHYVWLFSVEGTGRLTTPDQVYELPPGMLLAMPSWIPRRFEIVGECWKRINFTVMHDAPNDSLKCRELTVVHYPHMKQLVGTVEDYLLEQSSPNPDRDQALHHYGSLIALYLKRAAKSVLKNDDCQMYDRFGRLWMEVNARIEHHWTVNELAERLYVSTSYLHQLCRKQYNCGPLQYVTGLKMRRAEELLLHTQYSLAQIAESIGYSTEYSFSAAFYKQHNIRPGAFRKAPRLL